MANIGEYQHYNETNHQFNDEFIYFRNDSFYFYEPLWNFNVMAFYEDPDIECDVIGDKQTCR